MVTAAMVYLKARKMQRHPLLVDPELAAIMRNGGKGAQCSAWQPEFALQHSESSVAA